MDERVENSCWGVAAKAVAVFAVILFVTWLVGSGSETTAILAKG
jgi:hypothetical protein